METKSIARPVVSVYNEKNQETGRTVEMPAVFSARNEKLFLLKNLRKPTKNLAIRIRTNASGHAAWATELKCYLMPNFKHENILPFYGFEKFVTDGTSNGRKRKLPVKFWNFDNIDKVNYESDSSVDSLPQGSFSTKDASSYKHKYISGKYEFHNDFVQPRDKSKLNNTIPALRDLPKLRIQFKKRVPKDQTHESDPRRKLKVEYWILIKLGQNTILRDFLQDNTMGWTELLSISTGIMRGIRFLHERNFIYSDLRNYTLIHDWMQDKVNKRKYLSLPGGSTKSSGKHIITIIHRYLNSLNIVLGHDLTPRIWNFGGAYVHNPNMELGQGGFIEENLLHKHLLSVYSAPELITGQVELTLNGIKMIDMYASSFILWEMLWRTKMPVLEGICKRHKRDRECPAPYEEPMSTELQGYKFKTHFLYHCMVLDEARPFIRPGWLRGKATSEFVTIMTSLWSRDHEERLHSSLVISKLKNISRDNVDQPCLPTPSTKSKRYKVPRNWRFRVKNAFYNANPIMLQGGPSSEDRRENSRIRRGPTLSWTCGESTSSSSDGDTSSVWSINSDKESLPRSFINHLTVKKSCRRRAMLRGHWLDGPSIGYLSKSSDDGSNDEHYALSDEDELSTIPSWMQFEKMEANLSVYPAKSWCRLLRHLSDQYINVTYNDVCELQESFRAQVEECRVELTEIMDLLKSVPLRRAHQKHRVSLKKRAICEDSIRLRNQKRIRSKLRRRKFTRRMKKLSSSKGILAAILHWGKNSRLWPAHRTLSRIMSKNKKLAGLTYLGGSKTWVMVRNGSLQEFVWDSDKKVDRIGEDKSEQIS